MIRTPSNENDDRDSTWEEQTRALIRALRDGAARAHATAAALERALEQSEHEAKRRRASLRVIEGSGIIALLTAWRHAVADHHRAVTAFTVSAALTAAVGIGIVVGRGVDAPDGDQQQPAPTARHPGGRSPGGAVTATPPAARTVPPEPTLEPAPPAPTVYAAPSTIPAGDPPTVAGEPPVSLHSPEATTPGRTHPPRHAGRPPRQPPGTTSPGHAPRDRPPPGHHRPACPLRVELPLGLRVCV